MKSKLFVASLLGLLSTFNFQLSTFGQGTAFTYEGRLNDNGNPANGSYDLTFALFSVSSGAGQLGNTLTNSPTGVTSGLFSVTLDFGANFPGEERWLEIGVRTNGSGGFSTLSPRQKITPTPYAITAGNVSGVVPGGNLAGIYSNALTLNSAGNSFTGNGAGLAALNAGQLASGTVADARLSANVALRNANQTFSGINTFADARGNFSGNGGGFTNLNLALNSGGAIQWGYSFLSSSRAVGAGPHSVVAADVNGDGRLDLVSANYTNNTLSVLLYNNNGSFVLSSSPGVGTGPLSVVAADVNGDGRLDLISANNGDDTLSVLTNNGHGGFVLASSPVVGHFPWSVVAADVNGDGQMDLISANAGGPDTLSVLTNNGSGGFGSNSTINIGVRPISVVAADVNGDGRVDLITANYYVNTLTVLTNNGSGGFGSNATLSVGAGPYSVVAADVNGDGRVDLISANSLDNTLSVLTNNGSGGFGFNASVNVGSGPGSVVAADVNGDGRVDLISANYNDNTLVVLTNNGSGGFVYASAPSVGIGPISVVAGDVNGDGRLDLISANFGDNTLSVLVNEAQFNGVFTGAALRAGGNGFTGQQTVTGGNVGIGTSSPQEALHVRGANAAQLMLQNSTSGHFWEIYAEFNNGNDNLVFHPDTGFGAYIQRSDGSYQVNSDARLKRDIIPLDGVLDRVLQLRPVSYHFRNAPANARLSLGLIAQEVEPLFPEVVGERSGMKSLAYSELVPVTVRAIQELSQKVNSENAELREELKRRDAANAKLSQDLKELKQVVNKIAAERNGGAK